MSRVSDSLYGSTIADITYTYTTDDPAITPNSVITIADGDAAMTRADFQEVAEEVVAKINTILAALRIAGVIKS